MCLYTCLCMHVMCTDCQWCDAIYIVLLTRKEAAAASLSHINLRGTQFLQRVVTVGGTSGETGIEKKVPFTRSEGSW